MAGQPERRRAIDVEIPRCPVRPDGSNHSQHSPSSTPSLIRASPCAHQLRIPFRTWDEMR